MSVATAHSPRMGVLHRFRCARIGHYWATDGSGTRGVCVRCGKHREPITRLAVTAPRAVPDTPQGATAGASSEQSGPAGKEWLASRIAGASAEGCDVVHEAHMGTQDADHDSTHDHDLAERRSSPARFRPSPATIAVASLAIVGGVAYLALRTRRRH